MKVLSARMWVAGTQLSSPEQALAYSRGQVRTLGWGAVLPIHVCEQSILVFMKMIGIPLCFA